LLECIRHAAEAGAAGRAILANQRGAVNARIARVIDIKEASGRHTVGHIP